MWSSRPLLIVALGLAIPVGAAAQTPVPINALAAQTHIHGLAVDLQDPQFLLVATHHGLFRAGPNGQAQQISIVQDFMGFNPHPSQPLLMFASGHPAQGGNLGFIVSTDGGRTWTQRSPGANGPVDFHMIAVSRADPSVVYGAFGFLQRSEDAGVTWGIAGALPAQTVDLAVSAIDARTVYAATSAGLYVSSNGGANWSPIILRVPVSLVEVAPDGSVYAFLVGQGLFRATGDGSPLVRVESDWMSPYLFHLAIDPTDPERLFAATQDGRIVLSTDAARTWADFGA